MKKVMFWVAMAVIMSLTLGGVNSAMAARWPIKIEYVTFVETTHTSAKILQQILADAEEKSEGKLKFIYRGGPESLSLFAQGSATASGAVDMVFTTPSFMGNLAPGLDTLILCQTPVTEHREDGLYDYLNKVVNKRNLQFLMMYPREMGTAFTILTQKKIETLADFKGMTARGGDWFDDFAKAMGISVTGIRFNEEYTALERGVIDFARMTTDSMYKYRVFELAKYMLDAFFGSAPNSIFMNLDKWDSIPKDVQDMLLDTLYAYAPTAEAATKADVDECMKEMMDSGVQLVSLPPEDTKIYLDTMEKSILSYCSKGGDEKIAQEIYKLTRKK